MADCITLLPRTVQSREQVRARRAEELQEQATQHNKESTTNSKYSVAPIIGPRWQLQRQAPFIPSPRLPIAVTVGQEHQDDWKSRRRLPETPMRNGSPIPMPSRNNSRASAMTPLLAIQSIKSNADDDLNSSFSTTARSHGCNTVQGKEGGRKPNCNKTNEKPVKIQLYRQQSGPHYGGLNKQQAIAATNTPRRALLALSPSIVARSPAWLIAIEIKRSVREQCLR